LLSADVTGIVTTEQEQRVPCYREDDEGVNEMAYGNFSNHPTWLVHLWMTNESHSYLEAITLTMEAIEGTCSSEYLTHQEEAERQLASVLEDSIDGQCFSELEGCSLASDLLSSAIQDVNWNQIARVLIDETGFFQAHSAGTSTPDVLG